MGFGRGRLASPAEPASHVPRERQARTVRRVMGFFRPYRLSVAIVVVTIIATSLLGLINPYLLKLLIDDAIPQQDFGLLSLYVGLMIVIPIISGLIGVFQSYVNNVIGQNVMQDLRNALYAHLQRMPLRFFTETRTGEIQSRLANDVGGVQAVVTDTAASVASNLAIAISTIVAMFLIDWRLTLLSLGLLPFFLYLTYRVGKVRREVSSATQKSLAELTAATEETLSVSGILLTKTFGQQTAAISRFRGLNRELASLQIRQAMVGRWFFMIIGTIFSITPAFVYFLAGVLTIQNDPTAPTIGDIVAFTTLQSRLFFPLGQLLNVQVEIQGALALFDRIFEYLDMEPDIVDAPNAIALDPAAVEGRVRLRDVSFAYPTGAVPPDAALAAVEAGPGSSGADGDAVAGEAGPRDGATGGATGATVRRALGDATTLEREHMVERAGASMDAVEIAAADALAEKELTTDGARGGGAADARALEPVPEREAAAGAPADRRPFALEDVDVTVEPGQLVALVGPSGAGKTTTTYLIPRLYDVDDGAVEIDGVDVRRITQASLGLTIGFVTQETYLFHASIRDNLRFARPEATDAELEAATSAAAIHDRIMELPAGYDTVVGERGYKLSGGEKQRIAIARVLLKDPRILILDEATSSLDTVSERLIQSALERLMMGRTTIAIAHRLSTILRADQILVFERGRVAERGTHAELLARGGLYARLYHEQFESVPSPEAEPADAIGAVPG
jgi:ATP-binding cassette subfamily B protein